MSMKHYIIVSIYLLLKEEEEVDPYINRSVWPKDGPRHLTRGVYTERYN